MQLAIVGDWIAPNVSPHTGQAVTCTRRLAKANEWYIDPTILGHSPRVVYTPPGLDAEGRVKKARDKYVVGMSYAIQPTRGAKAVGRLPSLTSIRYQDVRTMTDAEAVAAGWRTALDYLLVWTKLHDLPARSYADCDLLYDAYQRSDYPDSWTRMEGSHWLSHLKDRPDARYGAWVLSWA